LGKAPFCLNQMFVSFFKIYIVNKTALVLYRFAA